MPPAAKASTAIPRRRGANAPKVTPKTAPRPAPPPPPPPVPSQSPASACKTPPATRKAPCDRVREARGQREPRRSSGPLSARTMAKIRCPSRVDFINAVNGVPPPTPCFGSAAALARARARVAAMGAPDSPEDASANPSVRAPLVALRTSRLTDESHGTERSPVSADGASLDGATGVDECSSGGSPHQRDGVRRVDGDVDDDDDQGVPAYLNSLVLDAMDRIGECDELKAIVAWMDSVRSRVGYVHSITDIDLSNGVALLQTLTAVAPEAFDDAPPESCIIRTYLDEAGNAARGNMQNVRDALRRFPWRDGPEGTPLEPVPFERVDVWSLAGYAVLAAVTGEQSSAEVDRMLQMDDWVQDRLSDIVSSGLQALGAASCQDGGRHSGWFAERKRNEFLESEIMELHQVVEQLKMERDDLLLLLADERQAGEEARAELRWLRAALGRRKRALGESNEISDLALLNGGNGERKESGSSCNLNLPRRRPVARSSLVDDSC